VQFSWKAKFGVNVMIIIFASLSHFNTFLHFLVFFAFFYFIGKKYVQFSWKTKLWLFLCSKIATLWIQAPIFLAIFGQDI
jgi:hypothetical protein